MSVPSFQSLSHQSQKSSLPQVGSSKLSFYPWFPNGCPVRGLQCGGSAIQRVQRPRELISCESANALNPRKSPPINGVLHLVLCIIVAAGNAQCGKIHWLAIPASTLVSSWNHGGPIVDRRQYQRDSGFDTQSCYLSDQYRGRIREECWEGYTDNFEKKFTYANRFKLQTDVPRAWGDQQSTKTSCDHIDEGLFTHITIEMNGTLICRFLPALPEKRIRLILQISNRICHPFRLVALKWGTLIVNVGVRFNFTCCIYGHFNLNNSLPPWLERWVFNTSGPYWVRHADIASSVAWMGIQCGQ